jgi:photosystem II stability/assembly factor-like uncharacterized protein
MTRLSLLAIPIVLLANLAEGVPAARAEAVSLAELTAETHVHGLAVDRQDPRFLLIATHHGLFRAPPEGPAERVSAVQDFMGFNPHPSEAGTLYASGHPAGGGNLGFIASTDGGRTWEQVSPGAGGPVDFHQMTVSPADPQTIYGVYGSLQVSRDGGRTWSVVAQAPEGLIDLAASGQDPRKLYAATESGLLVSNDGGLTWTALSQGAPVSMVEVAPDGRLFAFILGQGLLSSAEEPFALKPASQAWEDRIVLHLAIDPADPQRLFAATHDGELLASGDGGRSWAPFGS